MSASDANGSVAGAESRTRRAPIEFAGTFDENVIQDIHRLEPRSGRRFEVFQLIVGIGGLILGTLMVILSTIDLESLFTPASSTYRRLPFTGYSVVLFYSYIIGAVFLVAWWLQRKGWARFLLGQLITGRIQGAGIVVDQLSARAGWGEFNEARLSDSAAVLFVWVSRGGPPKVFGFHGLSLHRSFFASDEAWQEVSQLIRESVRNVSFIAGA